MKAYLLRIVCTVILGGVVCRFFDGKSTKYQLIRTLCGIMTVISVAAPLIRIQIPDMAVSLDGLRADGEKIAACGEEYTNLQLADIIKDRAEAYILDKAKSYRTEVLADVDVSADSPPQPCGVTITGNLSPYVRTRMESCIEQDLGIPKEKQVWRLANG